MYCILINKCYGGFSFSYDFMKLFQEKHPEYFTDKHKPYYFFEAMSHRYNPDVIQMFQEKGSKWCSGQYSNLVLKEIPDNVSDYVYVGEYDGYESLNIDWKKAFYRLYEFESLSEKQTFRESLEALENQLRQ